MDPHMGGEDFDETWYWLLLSERKSTLTEEDIPRIQGKRLPDQIGTHCESGYASKVGCVSGFQLLSDSGRLARWGTKKDIYIHPGEVT